MSVMSENGALSRVNEKKDWQLDYGEQNASPSI